MFAAHIIEPAGYGMPARHRVLFIEKKSDRDNLVRFVKRNSEEWSEFRKNNPYTLAPSCFCWYPGTTAEPIGVRDARKLIGDDDPIFEGYGNDRAYAYVPFVMYEFKVLPYGVRIGWKDGRHYEAA